MIIVFYVSLLLAIWKSKNKNRRNEYSSNYYIYICWHIANMEIESNRNVCLYEGRYFAWEWAKLNGMLWNIFIYAALASFALRCLHVTANANYFMEIIHFMMKHRGKKQQNDEMYIVHANHSYLRTLYGYFEWCFSRKLWLSFKTARNICLISLSVCLPVYCISKVSHINK